MPRRVLAPILAVALLCLAAWMAWTARSPLRGSPAEHIVTKARPSSTLRTSTDAAPSQDKPQGETALAAPATPAAGGRLHITVSNADGALTACTVFLRREGSPVEQALRVTVGADGTASISVAAGEWTIHAETPDAVAHPVHAIVDEGEGVDVELRAEPMPTASGLVTDPDGRVVEGATVLCCAIQDGGEPKDPLWWTTTDAAGRYCIPVVCGGRLQAESPGLAPTCANVGYEKPGVDLRIDLRLHRSVRLVGRVTDRQGNPIPEARIDADFCGEEAPPWPYPREASTDVAGRFAIPELREESYRVSASAPGFVCSPVPFDGTHPADVDLVLLRSASIEGTIRARGAPLTTTEVQLGLRPEGSPAGTLYLKCYTPLRRGAFRLESLAPGKYRVQVHMQGCALSESREIEVTEGMSVTGVEVDLLPGATVRGTIRAADTGAPLPRAQCSTPYSPDGTRSPISRPVRGSPSTPRRAASSSR